MQSRIRIHNWNSLKSFGRIPVSIPLMIVHYWLTWLGLMFLCCQLTKSFCLFFIFFPCCFSFLWRDFCLRTDKLFVCLCWFYCLFPLYNWPCVICFLVRDFWKISMWFPFYACVYFLYFSIVELFNFVVKMFSPSPLWLNGLFLHIVMPGFQYFMVISLIRTSQEIRKDGFSWRNTQSA